MEPWETKNAWSTSFNTTDAPVRWTVDEMARVVENRSTTARLSAGICVVDDIATLFVYAPDEKTATAFFLNTLYHIGIRTPPAVSKAFFLRCRLHDSMLERSHAGKLVSVPCEDGAIIMSRNSELILSLDKKLS